MAYFSVSYQLNKNKDYKPLWDAFSAIEAHKAMDSFYLVDYETTSQGLLDHLVQFVDEDDFIFVSEMESKPAKYKCYKGTKAWIDNRF